jgi:hypothetical protein
MKTSIKSLSIGFLLSLIMLSACDDPIPAPAPSVAIIGKWKYTAVNNKGLSASDFVYFKDFQKDNSAAIWEFKSDNSLIIDTDDNDATV